MNRLLEIQEKMRDNVALIAKLERSLAVHHSPSVAATLRSLHKLNRSYEEEFRSAAAADFVDVVSYRLFEGNEQPSVSLVGRALDAFQTLYAILYEAAESGKPKDTAHLNPSTVSMTDFKFAYAFSGSVGFVFTIPNERLLIGETKLDEAMQDLFRIVKANDTDSIKGFARQFGLAPVRAIYKWASALASSSVGADIEWQKNDATKGKVTLQPAEVECLKNLIDLTSDQQVKEYKIEGTLVGYDSKSLTFKLEPLNETDTVRGSIADGADIPAQVKIPQRYSAKIRTTVKIRYATEQEERKNELLSLTSPL